MASIRSDFRNINNENSNEMVAKSIKQPLSARVHSVKKQAFGELKNVMHNQTLGATPFKGNVAQKVDGIPGIFSASKSLCKDVLRKQQSKQNFAEAKGKLDTGKPKQIVEQALKQQVHSKNRMVFDEELFDSWDYPRECCINAKSDEEIWAEMDMLDFDKILNIADDTDEVLEESQHFEFDFQDPLDNFDLEEGMPNFDLAHDSGIADLPALSLPELPETDFGDDLGFEMDFGSHF